MKKFDLIATMAGPWGEGTNPNDVFCAEILGAPYAHTAAIMEGLAHPSRRVQGGCAQIASMLAETYPEALYDYIDVFLGNLDAKAPILKWEAVCTVGNLAVVDLAEKIAPHVDTIIGHLSSDSIVLQGHAAKALGKIARAYPRLAPRILDILIASEPRFPARRVGVLIEALRDFAPDPDLRPKAREFVQRWLGSEIRSVATKASKAARTLSEDPATYKAPRKSPAKKR